MPQLSRLALSVLAVSLAAAPQLGAQSREEKVRNDRKKVEAAGFWIYGDLKRGLEEARTSGKPLVVVLRCLPCEECVKLDDQLIDDDRDVRKLLEKFVRVRLVSTNGLDLSIFQFDTDQSFAIFFLNADGTVYGRFGTRSHRTAWAGDVSIEGLARALEGALELHAGYPGNRATLADKRGPAPVATTPENLPVLKGKYGPTLNYEGNVVKSCIHCHQIGDALRKEHLKQGGSIPDELLFSYPHPRALGLVLDPRERAVALEVKAGSLAEKSGFKPGDRIETLEGQPLLSIADVQWVLHRTRPEGAVLTAKVVRSGSPLEVKLALPAGWRERDEISWRASSWELRQSATGGLLLEALDAEERGRQGIAAGQMALRVEHVGEYAPHDRAKKAGVKKNDIIVSWNGRTDLLRETDVLAFGIRTLKPGDKIQGKALREGKPVDFEFKFKPGE